MRFPSSLTNTLKKRPGGKVYSDVKSATPSNFLLVAPEKEINFKEHC